MKTKQVFQNEVTRTQRMLRARCRMELKREQQRRSEIEHFQKAVEAACERAAERMRNLLAADNGIWERIRDDFYLQESGRTTLGPVLILGTERADDKRFALIAYFESDLEQLISEFINTGNFRGEILRINVFEFFDHPLLGKTWKPASGVPNSLLLLMKNLSSAETLVKTLARRHGELEALRRSRSL